MLDQNTDRMWYVIGAVVVGAAILLLLNGTVPDLFAQATGTYEEKTEDVTHQLDNTSIAPPGVNILTNGHEPVKNDNYLIKKYDLAYHDLNNGEEVTVTLKGDLNDAKTSFGLYNSGGNGNDQIVQITHDDFNEDGIAQKTFDWKQWKPDRTNDWISVCMLYNSLDGGVDHVTNEIEWIELEKGSGDPIESYG